MSLTFGRANPSILANGSVEFWGDDASETRVRCILTLSAFTALRPRDAPPEQALADFEAMLPVVGPLAARLHAHQRDKDLIVVGLSRVQRSPEGVALARAMRGADPAG